MIDQILEKGDISFILFPIYSWISIWNVKEVIVQIKASLADSLDILKGKVDANTDGGLQANLALLSVVNIYLYSKQAFQI